MEQPQKPLHKWEALAPNSDLAAYASDLWEKGYEVVTVAVLPGKTSRLANAPLMPMFFVLSRLRNPGFMTDLGSFPLSAPCYPSAADPAPQKLNITCQQ